MGVSTHSKGELRMYLVGNHLVDPDMPRRLRRIDGVTAVLHLIGTWKGKPEPSYLCLIDRKQNPAVEADLLIEADLFEQECILRLTNHKHGLMNAELVYLGREAEHIGFFRSMPKNVIEALGMDYTYRADLNTYWTIWPTDTTQMDALEAEIQRALSKRKKRKWRIPCLPYL